MGEGPRTKAYHTSIQAQLVVHNYTCIYIGKMYYVRVQGLLSSLFSLLSSLFSFLCMLTLVRYK